MTQFTRIQNAGLAYRLGELDQQLRTDIRAALLQSGDEKYLDLAGRVHDLGDEAVANELIETGDELIERHVQELRAIEAARRRLADGSIDRCVDCGDDIGYERLLAYPVAVRCVVCQRRHEKTYAHEDTPRM
ncbi:MAG: TraR/DksA family transcriptional regulator [Betaproteobacteria bacterium]|nr:TraR/DksA family transcriptional regulator [Betaproteobacteria bacterium]